MSVRIVGGSPMALDITRIDGLSSVGLLADKVRVQLARIKERGESCDVDTGVFVRASRYLSCAIDGLNRMGTLKVDQNTVFAIDAYQTVISAVPKPKPEDVAQMTEFIDQLLTTCEQLGKNENVGNDSISKLDTFFSHLSRYTRQERDRILQQSSMISAPGIAEYAQR